jgi:CheY-specific phosphatase CheX
MSHHSSSNPAFGLMADHLSHAVTELFAGYGLAVERALSADTGAAKNEQSVVAVIGYTGDTVRGAVVLAAPEWAVREWLQAVGVADGEVLDTVGEFSNMLLGRLKAKLLREGVTVLAATPTTGVGNQIRISAGPGRSQWSAFDGPGWQVTLRLDAAFEPGFELPAPGSAQEPAEAGEAFLFESFEEERNP